MQDKPDLDTGASTIGRNRQEGDRGMTGSRSPDSAANVNPSSGMRETSASGSGGSLTEQAHETLSGVGSSVVSRVDAQKDRTAEGLQGFARALRKTGNELREQDTDLPIDRYVSSAADQVERLSGFLRSHDVRELMDGAERMAREQPALFLGGAFVLGLLGARFLKSSGRHSSRDRLGQQGSSASYGDRYAGGGSPYGRDYPGAPPVGGASRPTGTPYGGGQMGGTASSNATTGQGYGSTAQSTGTAQTSGARSGGAGTQPSPAGESGTSTAASTARGGERS